MKRGRPKGRSSDTRSFGPLGDLIRSARLEKGLGLLDVAKACRCSIQFVSNIEHGRAPLPWDKAPLVAAALGIAVEKIQAANLAVRSDFREFVAPATPGKVLRTGVRRLSMRRQKPLSAQASSIKMNQMSTESASVIAIAAIAAKDAQFQDILKAYEAASSKNRKRFVRAALELLA